MRYTVKHVTTYSYSEYVTLCQNQARLSPINNQYQACTSNSITVSPKVDYLNQFMDYFGNQVTVFDVPIQHKTLVVTSVSEVEVFSRSQQSLFETGIAWEQVRALIAWPSNKQLMQANEFTYPSSYVPLIQQAREYALLSFTPERSLVDATRDLMARIFNEFTYDPSFTTISTPLTEVFAHKRGVCQDFAHFALACIRSLGLAARYVSGYIETIPPEGQPRLEGADATHAWFAVFVPEFGWLDFDPTNNVMPDEQHITLATGRDFADVTPLKGIVFGGGAHQLTVAVDMIRK